MKPLVYLDTSILSALVDERAPERRSQTELFWSRRSTARLITCEVAREELNATPDESRRTAMLSFLADIEVLPVTDEARALADRYISAAVFTAAMRNDALHAAAAAVARAEVLLSWNFRHLVNRRRRLAVNAVNINTGFPVVDIISPPEL